MHPFERFRTRVAEAFGGMLLTLTATVGGVMVRAAREATPPTEPTTSISIGLMTGLLTSLPGIVTVIGILGATVIAGPFGLIGAILETIGITQILYYQSEAGLWMVVFGAALVAVGALIPWSNLFETWLESGGRR